MYIINGYSGIYTFVTTRDCKTEDKLRDPNYVKITIIKIVISPWLYTIETFPKRF